MPFFSEVKSGGAGFFDPCDTFLRAASMARPRLPWVRFHLCEAREHGANAEVGGFSAVDAGEERVGEAVDHLGTIMAFDECGNGLVVIVFVAEAGTRGMEEFLRHPKFRLPGEERRKSGGQDFGGDHEHQAVGHFDEAAAGEDVGFAVDVVRADELIAEAERAGEIGGPGFLGDEGIRAGFDDASVDISVRRTPPRRGVDSNRVYSTAAPERRCSSRAKAAASPEMPPPMMAMRVMIERKNAPCVRQKPSG